VVGLDTGCVWGGQLTAMSLGNKSELVMVPGLNTSIYM
jgi:bis(5'-nucleosyl)-tetraphosphatase (symmetrical)